MDFLRLPDGDAVVLMRGHEETTPTQVSALRATIFAGPSEPASPDLLFGTRMPAGAPAGRAGALAAPTGEPKLLPGAGRGGAGSGLAQGASRLLAQAKACATNGHEATIQWGPGRWDRLKSGCAPNGPVVSTGCSGGNYIHLNRNCAPSGHRGAGAAAASSWRTDPSSEGSHERSRK